MTRESTSRPSVSVPKGCWSDGGRREASAMLTPAAVALGSPRTCGTHKSAERATITMNTIQIAAMMASLFFLRRPQASPQSVRDAALSLELAACAGVWMCASAGIA